MKRFIPAFAVFLTVVTSAVTHAQSTVAPFGYHPVTNYALCPPSSDYMWSSVPDYGQWTNSNNYNNYTGDYYDCVAQQPASSSAPFGYHPVTNYALCPPSSDYMWSSVPDYGQWTNSNNYNNYTGDYYDCVAQQLVSTSSPPVTTPLASGGDVSRLNISSASVDSNHIMISWGTLSNDEDAAADVDFYRSDNWHPIAEDKWTNSGWINHNNFCSTGCDNGSLGGQTNVTLYRVTSIDSDDNNVIDYRLLDHDTGLSSGIDDPTDMVVAVLPRNPKLIFRNNQYTAYSNASFNHGDTGSTHGATYTSLINLVPDSESYSDHDYARGASKGDGNFRVSCQWSHFANDDPIVAYNNFGNSHLHMYFGNTMADASSTKQSLIDQGGGTCNGFELNRSAYWMPALMRGDDEVVLPYEIFVYYKGGVVCPGGYKSDPRATEGRDHPKKCIFNDYDPGNGIHNPQNGESYWSPELTDPSGNLLRAEGEPMARAQDIVDLEQGLELLGGQTTFTQDIADDDFSQVFWSCGSNGERDDSTKSRTIPTNCPQRRPDTPADRKDPRAFVNATIYFPQCWNRNASTQLTYNTNLTGDTEAQWTQQHVMRVPQWEDCPSQYGHNSNYWNEGDDWVRIPEIGILAYWKTDGTESEWRLSSDTHHGASHPPGSTLHADWLGGWHEDLMTDAVENCLHEERNCTIGETGSGYNLKRAYNDSSHNGTENGNTDTYPGRLLSDGSRSYYHPIPSMPGM